jgi:hypothetical protein
MRGCRNSTQSGLSHAHLQLFLVTSDKGATNHRFAPSFSDSRLSLNRGTPVHASQLVKKKLQAFNTFWAFG